MVAQIVDTMSRCRFDTYLNAAGRDRDRALRLYIWNARMGASFHILIQAAEVALRNRINSALVAKFGADWWDDPRPLAILDRERKHDLDTVLSRILKKGLTLDTNQVLASLSFGFWVGILHARYNPNIWSSHFKTAFPRFPNGVTRHKLFLIVGRIAKFRNRISHHEPLLREDISKLYGEMMQLLNWICPDTVGWVRTECEVPRLFRNKP